MSKLTSEQIEAARISCQELYNQERFESAVAAYQQQLNNIPNDPELLLGLGNALIALNRPEEALLHYEKILKIYPNYEKD